ncbi:hypothetical protein PGB90_003828 [Kerria lacca]
MLVLQQPSKELTESIYGEFNTTPDAVRRDAKTLMEWLEKQPHLPNVTDEEFLMHCIMRCKNSLEKTKQVLDRYYTIRAVMPEVYDNRDPDSPTVEFSMKALAFIPLPKLSSDGCRVSICRVFDPSLSDSVNPDEVIKAVFMAADLRLEIDFFHSDILIFDLKDFSMTIITMVMSNLRKFLTPGTKGLPMRIKTLYIINAPSSAESLITLAKSFIRKDLVKKIIVLKNPNELLNVLPKEILPKDYGGEEPPLSEIKDTWLKTLKHHRDWFLAENKVKADNTKRLSHESSAIFDASMEGSFRKITLD